jgi:hypothetical protein
MSTYAAVINEGWRQCFEFLLVIAEWWLIHRPIHHSRRLSNKLYIYKMEVIYSLNWFAEVKSVLRWFLASIMKLRRLTCPVLSQVLADLQKFGPYIVLIMEWWWIHMSIQHSQWWSNTFQIYLDTTFLV